jgi:nitrite reductase (NADH) large subunit
VAGITAAETARKLNPSANITIFSQERDGLYFRPRLPELISGKLEVEKIYAHPESWYLDNNLELRKGESLLDICLDNRQVRGSLGSRLIYDRLLIATGAESSRPGPVNYDLPGVFTVRRLADAMGLFYESKRSKSAVLLGAGLLSLEIGFALASAGLKVHMLEMAPRVLPRKTTPESSKKLQNFLAEKGFEFHLNAGVDGIEGRERFQGIKLKDGTNIEAQILVVAAGISPNLQIGKDLGLKIERGLVVDQYLETSLENIYAAGDCAQTPDGQGGLWTIGRQEGLTAGHNIACDRKDRKVYVPIPLSSTLKVAGLDLVAAGDIDPEDKLKSVVAENASLYRKVVVDESGTIVGYTNLGTTKGNRELAAALGKKKLSAEFLRALADPDFDFGKLANL